VNNFSCLDLQFLPIPVRGCPNIRIFRFIGNRQAENDEKHYLDKNTPHAPVLKQHNSLQVK